MAFLAERVAMSRREARRGALVEAISRKTDDTAAPKYTEVREGACELGWSVKGKANVENRKTQESKVKCRRRGVYEGGRPGTGIQR